MAERKDSDELNSFFKRNSGKCTDQHFDRIIEKAREIEDSEKDSGAASGLVDIVIWN